MTLLNQTKVGVKKSQAFKKAGLDPAIFHLDRHMEIAMNNVAIRLHNKSVKNGHIPIDTRDTLASVKVRKQGWRQVELSYNTDYSGRAWKHNKTGITEWSLKDWNNNKQTICKQLIKDLISDKKPRTERLIK